MKKDNSEEVKVPKKKRSLGKRMLRGLMWLVLLFVILMTTITLLLRSETVQNKLGNWLTSKLSKDLGSKVEFKHIDFEFFDKLVLDSFLVEDHRGDTLLYSEELVINFNSGIVSLYNKNLEVTDLTLRNAQLNLKRKEGERKNNLDQLLAKLFPPSNDKPSNTEPKPFYLSAEFLYLENVSFYKEDEVNGNILDVFIKKGTIEVDKIDLEGKEIILESADFDKTMVKVDLFKGKPLPKDTLTLVEVSNAPEVSNIDTSKVFKPFRLLVNHIDFTDGKFNLQNFRKALEKTTPPEILDFTRLETFDIALSIDSFQMSEMNFDGHLKNITARERSGFFLEEGSVAEVKVTPRRAEVNGIKIITPLSNVQDTIIFKYRNYESFRDFPAKVNMDIRFENSNVAIQDVITFAPKLKDNKFFANNAKEVIQLDGIVKGRINNLRGEDLKLVLGKNTIIEGDFSSRNLSDKGNESLNLGLKRFKTNVLTLRQLIPNFNPPSNFDKLGNIGFSGRFDGFFVDFVAYGNLKTDIGSAKMDMRLDLKNGKEKANYSGNLNLIDFDLASWTDNVNLGNVTVTSKIYDGVGLTAQTATAKIDANVDRFNFRGYTYQDFKMDGKLDQNSFDGDFIIKDKNIDLDFNGSVDFTDSIPVFDFAADINTLNLDDLNLAKQDIGLSGKLDLNIRDINISNLTGEANFSNLIIQKNQTENYGIDTLSFSSVFDNKGKRVFNAESEIFEGVIEGDFDIQEVPAAFVLFVEKNYPEISEKLGIKSKQQNLKSTAFDFDIKIIDSKNFTHLLDPKLDTIKNLMVKGDYDGINYKVNVELEVEEITYDNIEVGGIKWNSSAFRSLGRLNSLVPFYAIINGKNSIPELNVQGRLNRDTLVFDIGARGDRNTFDVFHLGGKIFFSESGFNISLSNDSLILFGERWEISEDNFLNLGKKVFSTDDFVLNNRDRTVSIGDIEGKGIHLRLENFNTGFIDSIWYYPQMDFAGNYSIDIKSKNIFELNNFEAVVATDTFWVNNDDWGKLEMKATLADLESQVNANLNIQRGLKELDLDGFYVLPTTKKIVSKEDTKVFTNKVYPANYFDFDLNIINYPLNISRYFIGEHTSDIEGLVDLQVDLTGFPKKIESNGSAKIYKGAITVDYLNTRYFFGEDQPTSVRIDSRLFDFTGGTMKDRFGNIGYVSGGITHTNLRYLGLNARLFSDRILVLDTDKFDNPSYYGQGIGQVDASFTGLMKYVTANISATTGRGSQLFIPVQADQGSAESSFIVFRKKNDTDESSGVANEIRGMDVNMNINMTEDAQVSLIFDERAGDILIGRGTGALQMTVPRSGDIKLYGGYTIGSGEYLFTLYNIVNKRFNIERGGTIVWQDGDPFGAQLNLDAKYDRLSTSVYNFIREYIELGDDDLKTQSRTPTDVDLKMNLSGDLLKPDINFGITFPELGLGNVKNYVDTKLNILRTDQNEMNRQVFGLIVIGGFLPSGQGNAFTGNEISTSGINTVSEYFSSRLSLYMTELLSEVFSEVGFISGVDFDIAYNIYEGSDVQLGTGSDPAVLTGSQMQVNFNPRLFNDRLSLDGSFVRSTESASGGTFIGGDIVIEYAISDDRRFKVRFYQRSQQDLDNNRRDRTGLGINYRRQFNTFGEFIQGMKKAAKDSAPKVNN